SITFCASLRHSDGMNRARLSVLLPLGPLMLAVLACSGEQRQGDRARDGASAPFGFELAMAETVDTGHRGAALVGVSPEQLAAQISKGQVRLIDVRTAEEVAEGIIPGAEHIPLDTFDPAALDLSDGRAVVLYCRSGRRSGIAGEELAAATGEAAVHLEGGIIAWQAAGQRIQKQP
ncbi:MAG: rhodanese-like domain-containing protein, partial [Erythrobacter sp.]